MNKYNLYHYHNLHPHLKKIHLRIISVTQFLYINVKKIKHLPSKVTFEMRMLGEKTTYL